MLNFQFNSVSRPHPLRRGERRATESGDKIRRAWDGMGEKEKVGTDRGSKDVCGLCVMRSTAWLRCVEWTEKEKKRRKKELRVIEMNQCRKRKSLRVLRLVLMTDMPAMRVEWPFQDPDMDSCTCCFYTQWIDSC
jgi:hypothetical protein